MKKLTTLSFALMLLAVTFGCGGGETEEAPPPAETAAPAATADEPAAAETEGTMPAEGEEEPTGEAAPKTQ